MHYSEEVYDPTINKAIAGTIVALKDVHKNDPALWVTIKDIINNAFGTNKSADACRNIYRRATGTMGDYMYPTNVDVDGELTHTRHGVDPKWHRGVHKDAPFENALIIPDMHHPFSVDGALEFLLYLQNKFNLTKVYCVGDILDFHALNFHGKEFDSEKFQDELEHSIEKLAPLYEAFPVVKGVMGNHDDLPYKRAVYGGFPETMLQEYTEMIKAPSGWQFWDEIHMGENCVFKHMSGSGTGKNPADTATKATFISHVSGHNHTSKNVILYPTKRKETIFSVQTGCLIDAGVYAMRYAKNYNMRLGTAFFVDGLPMGYCFKHWRMAQKVY